VAAKTKRKGSSDDTTGTEVAAPAAPAAAAPAAAYDCSKCPGYCCSYPVIQLNKADIARLAKHFSLTPEVAQERFTKSAHGYDLVMKRKKDEHFGKICRFFDTAKRRCTVYTARPAVCRSFPDEKTCGYWDFLVFERRHQKDPEVVAITENGKWA
jgi:uncharacterized protein